MYCAVDASDSRMRRAMVWRVVDKRASEERIACDASNAFRTSRSSTRPPGPEPAMMRIEVVLAANCRARGLSGATSVLRLADWRAALERSPLEGRCARAGGSRGGARDGTLERSRRLADDTQSREDRHERAFFEEGLEHGAVDGGGDLECRLVGFDLGDHLAGGHDVALALDPAGDEALFDRVAELRDLNAVAIS